MATPPTAIDHSQDDKIIYTSSQSFDIKEKKTFFKLNISYNDKILFIEIEKSDQFPKDLYTKYLSFDDLGKISKFFLQFDTLKEVVYSLQLIVKNNNISIIEEKNR